MDYAEFQQFVDMTKQKLLKKTFAENKKSIKIKKEKTVIKNLEKIFNAVLKISNKKGFQTMSMRNLSKESGISMGSLYTYFSSKEELLSMLQRQGRTLALEVIEKNISNKKNAIDRLRAAVKTHLYISESMQPWFYFSYMEAKNLNKVEREKAINIELYAEKVLTEILMQGENEGIFRARDHQLSASILILPMMRDWYLNRWKYGKRNVSVDQYADLVIEFIENYYLA
ncbi:Transcriptional regulator, TetR-type [Desulfonema limicola]|uniref:Transcriptional regulator, TetR-type n=1 Tax=Desulfonema limicola TaxID=45656 RepID=A0A975GEH2_9BACT|nr:TetR/AcrR family transcriptional regulator [Desulfonema limicola]QTA78208.1 Transcriptional regulator, TetR-type [Desulfonema limicola]